MWIWILIGFVVVGAIIGLLSEGNGEGLLGGALMGLVEGGGCLIRLLITAGIVLLAFSIFGSC